MTEPIRHRRAVCQRCLNAPARFYYRGRWRARADHDLCPGCFRRLMDSQRAERLAHREAA